MIKYAILGMLKEKSMSGYDIKKVMQDALYMYWSGNNNQVYKALVELGNDELVTCEVIHQDGAPSKKIYSITEKGRQTLDNWAGSQMPEQPEFKKPFLLQILNTDSIEPETVRTLIAQYRSELESHLAMQKEKEKREQLNYNDKRQFLKHMVYDNIFSFYQSELNWLENLERELITWEGEHDGT